MDVLTYMSPGKINLSLDIISRREDGYHEINTIMQTIDLYDLISIQKWPHIELTITDDSLPCDEGNIAYRVASIIIDRYNLDSGVKIHIEKNIPNSAGLAGGSAYAAGLIININKLYNLNLSNDEMMGIGALVGSDVSYLILGGTCLCTGRGEKVKSLSSFKGINVLIAKPNVLVSTADVYKGLDLSKISLRPDNNILLNAINNKDINTLANNLVNVLETVTIPMHPEIDSIKKTMMKHGALGSIMSGSGPTVFGIFTDEGINSCYNELSKSMKQVYITKTI
ncbi:MAG: 4-(cytidine 5'-diphospho)-2-C-methyl-D-erythritol kinase [Clostridium sp.]